MGCIKCCHLNWRLPPTLIPSVGAGGSNSSSSHGWRSNQRWHRRGRGSVRASLGLGLTPATAPGTGHLGTRKVSPSQSPAATAIPTELCLHLRPSPWGAVTRQRRRPHSLTFFYTTALPSLRPQPSVRSELWAPTAQGWVWPLSLNINLHAGGNPVLIGLEKPRSVPLWSFWVLVHRSWTHMA